MPAPREVEIINAKINIEATTEAAQKTLIGFNKAVGGSIKALNQNIKSLNLDPIQKNAAEAFDKLGKNTVQIDKLKDRINSLNTETAPGILGFLGRLDQVRSGLNLAFSGAGIGETATGVRQAIFGVEASTSFLAKGLDFLSNSFVSTSKAESVMAKDSEALALRMRDLTDTVTTQLKDFKQLGAEYGVSASELNSIDTSVQRSRNEFQRLSNVIQSTGKITPAQLAQIRNQSDLVLKQFQDLRTRGVIPLGSDLDKVLTGIENDFKTTVTASTNLSARFNTMENDAKKLGTGLRSVKAGDTFKEASKDANVFAASISHVGSAIQATVKPASLLKDVLFGTFLGGLLSNAVSTLAFTIQNTLSQIPGQLAELASNAAETQNRFEAVLTDLTDDAEQFVSTLAQDIGRDPFQIKDSLASIQAFNVGLGFSNEESLKMSESIQKLALDFASFNNTTDADAQSRFLSALSGSSEVLDKYGINIKEAAIEQESFKIGINKASADMSEQEKVIARLSIIYKSLSSQGAVGDALRTADSFANQQKRLTSNLTQLATTIGTQLLPALAPLLRILNLILQSLSGPIVTALTDFATNLANVATSIATSVQTTLSGAVNLNDTVSLIVATVIALFSGDWQTAWQLFVITISDAIDIVFDELNYFVDSGFDWGFSFVEQIADGIIDAAGRVLLLAIETVSNTIAGFLQPGSPPKEGPLSTIDEWGQGLMDVFADGIDASSVKKSLETQLHDATEEVLRIRQQIIDAERAGYVPPELKEKLKLAELEQKKIEDQIKATKKLGTEEEKVNKEATKKGGSSGSDREGVGRVKAEKKTAEEIRTKALAVLEQQLKDGTIKYEDYVQEKLKIEKKFNQDTLEEGKKATSENIRNIKTLQDELDRIAESKKKKKDKRPPNGIDIDIPTFDTGSSQLDVLERRFSDTGFNLGNILTTNIQEGIDKSFDNITTNLQTKFTELKDKVVKAISELFSGPQKDAIERAIGPSTKSIFQPILDFVEPIRRTFVGLVQGVSFASTAILLLTRRISIARALFGDLPDILRFVIDSFKNLKIILNAKNLELLPKGIRPLVAIFQKIAGVARPLFGFLNKAIDQLVLRLNPLTLLITAAVIGIIENLDLLADIFDDLTQRYNDAFSGIIDGFFKLTSTIGEAGVAFKGLVLIADIFTFGIFSRLFVNVEKTTEEFSFFGAAVSAIGVVFTELGDILNSFNPTIAGIFGGIFKILGGVEKVILIPILETIGAIFNFFAGDQTAAIDGLLRAFDALKSGTGEVLAGLIDIFATAFASLPDVVGEVIQSVLTTFGLENAGIAVNEFINKLTTDIKTGLFIVRDTIVALFEGDLSVQSIFESFGIGNIGTLISTNFTTAFEKLTEAATRLSEVFTTKIFPIFTKLFDQINVAAGPSLLKLQLAFISLQPTIDAIIAAFQKFFSSTSAFDTVQVIVVGAIIVIIGVIVTLSGIIIGLVNGITAAVETIITGINILLAGFTLVFDGIGKVIEGFSLFLTSVFSGDFATAITGLEIFNKGVTEIITGMVAIVVGLFQTLVGSVLSLITGFVDSIIDYFYTMYDELVGHSIIPDTVDAILSVFNIFGTDLDSLIAGIIKNILGYFLNVGGNIITALTTSLGSIKDKASGLLSSIFGGGQESSTLDTSQADQASASINQIVPLITNSIGSLQNLFNTFSTTLIDMSNVVLLNITTAFLTLENNLVGDESILQNISVTSVSILSEMSSNLLVVIDDLVRQAQSKLKTSEWEFIGQFIVEGLDKGIKDNSHIVLERLKELAKEAIQSAKDALGIKSPSIKFYEIGVNTMEGFNEGIAATPPKMGTISDAIGAAADVIENTLDDIDNLDDNKVDLFLQQVKAVFRANADEIMAISKEQGLSAAKKRLTDIFNNTINLSKTFGDTSARIFRNQIGHLVEATIQETGKQADAFEQQKKDFAASQGELVAQVQAKRAEIVDAFRKTTEQIRFQTNDTRNQLEDFFGEPITDNKLLELYQLVQSDDSAFGETVSNQIKLAYQSQLKLNGALGDLTTIEAELRKQTQQQSIIDSLFGNDDPEQAVEDAYKTGLELLDALGLGLEASVPDVLNNLSSLTDSMIAKIRDALGIHSPSTVFKGFGTNIGDSLSNGLAESTKYIPDQMAGIADSIVSSAQNLTNIGLSNGVIQGALSSGLNLSSNFLPDGFELPEGNLTNPDGSAPGIYITNNITNNVDLALAERRITAAVLRGLGTK